MIGRWVTIEYIAGMSPASISGKVLDKVLIDGSDHYLIRMETGKVKLIQITHITSVA